MDATGEWQAIIEAMRAAKTCPNINEVASILDYMRLIIIDLDPHFDGIEALPDAIEDVIFDLNHATVISDAQRSEWAAQRNKEERKEFLQEQEYQAKLNREVGK